MARQNPATMDDEAITSEIEHLESYMEECAAIGQGISTKDSVRIRQLRQERLDRR